MCIVIHTIDIKCPALDTTAIEHLLYDLHFTIMGIGDRQRLCLIGANHHCMNITVTFPERVSADCFLDIDLACREIGNNHRTTAIGIEWRARNRVKACCIRVDIKSPTLQVLTGIGRLDDLQRTIAKDVFKRHCRSLAFYQCHLLRVLAGATVFLTDTIVCMTQFLHVIVTGINAIKQHSTGIIGDMGARHELRTGSIGIYGKLPARQGAIIFDALLDREARLRRTYFEVGRHRVLRHGLDGTQRLVHLTQAPDQKRTAVFRDIGHYLRRCHHGRLKQRVRGCDRQLFTVRTLGKFQI